MATLNIPNFDAGLLLAANIYKATHSTTIKQVVSEAIAEKIGYPVPVYTDKRGAPKKVKK